MHCLVECGATLGRVCDARCALADASEGTGRGRHRVVLVPSLPFTIFHFAISASVAAAISHVGHIAQLNEPLKRFCHGRILTASLSSRGHTTPDESGDGGPQIVGAQAAEHVAIGEAPYGDCRYG